MIIGSKGEMQLIETDLKNKVGLITKVNLFALLTSSNINIDFRMNIGLPRTLKDHLVQSPLFRSEN